MTTFVIDAQVAIDLATGGATIPPTLTLLHSQALAPTPLRPAFESTTRYGDRGSVRAEDPAVLVWNRGLGV